MAKSIKKTKQIKKEKLTDKELNKLGKLIEAYQKKMRLWDWNIIVRVELLDDEGEYAEISAVDLLDKSAVFSLSKKGYAEFDWERLVIHELTHLLLWEYKEKMMSIIKNRDKFIEKNYLKPDKKTPMIDWANNQSELIDSWLEVEEEKICTLMESILTGGC